MIRKLLYLNALLLLGVLSCDPKVDPIDPDGGPYSCIQLFAVDGSPDGVHGPCTASKDWGALSLTAAEKDYLAFLDTVNVSGLAAGTVNMFAVWPNPVQIGGAMSCSVRSDAPDQAVKVKVVVVDEAQNIVLLETVRTRTNNTFALRMDSAKFKVGQYYRVYYQVGTNTQNLFEGYGNILVCKNAIIKGANTIEADCL